MSHLLQKKYQSATDLVVVGFVEVVVEGRRQLLKRRRLRGVFGQHVKEACQLLWRQGHLAFPRESG